MHTAFKIGIALLVLTVRLWRKLFFVKELFKSDLTEYISLEILLGLVVGGSLLYLVFEKGFRPVIWRSAMYRKGIALTPHWLPVIGNYKAISKCIEKA